MEEFKKKLKFRFQLCTLYTCSGTMLYFLLQRLTENVPDFSKGMLTGLLVGGDLLAVFYMIRCFVLLHDGLFLLLLFLVSFLALVLGSALGRAEQSEPGLCPVYVPLSWRADVDVA